MVDKVVAERRVRSWGADHRRAHHAADRAVREANIAAAAAGETAKLQHHYSKLYLPHRGMFCEPPADLQLGTRLAVRSPI